jgi:hypothetical protein
MTLGSPRLGPGFRRELPTGHLAMVQDPASLAKIIQEFITTV